MVCTHSTEERVKYAVTSPKIEEMLQAAFSVGPRRTCCYAAVRQHISAAVNQHATIEEAVFSVGVNPSLYNEDLTQLESELNRAPELAVTAENCGSRHSKVIEKK
jgi:hypothetical protein